MLSLLLSLPGVAAAEDKKIDKDQVPKAVIDAVAARYPAGKLIAFEEETEGGKKAYEISVEVGVSNAELIISPDGKILTEETVITVKDLPDAVTKALAASKYARATIRKIEKVVDTDKPRAPIFEIVVEQDAKKLELAFDAQGALTKVEEKGHKKG